MKDAYDQHRSQANKAPLHICTDEMAEPIPICFRAIGAAGAGAAGAIGGHSAGFIASAISHCQTAKSVTGNMHSSAGS